MWDPAMPFNAYAALRHHIPKQKRTVTIWSSHDASLPRRRAGGLVFAAGDPDSDDTEDRVHSQRAADTLAVPLSRSSTTIRANLCVCWWIAPGRIPSCWGRRTADDARLAKLE
jgi:hypothetical protein